MDQKIRQIVSTCGKKKGGEKNPRRTAERENEKIAVGYLRRKINIGQLAVEQQIICGLHQKTDACCTDHFRY